MYKAIQELKTRAKTIVLVSFLLLAAAFGLNGLNSHDRTTSLTSSEVVVQQEPQIKIQKQLPFSHLPIEKATVSREQYKVTSGDSLWAIASNIKPNNVETKEYIKVLNVVNNNSKLKPGLIDIPNAEDLKQVSLPDVNLKLNIYDSEIISHIKAAEGTSESQSVLKRKLIGGKVGPSFKNGKFYPYRDSTGNFTIGYGHYIGKNDRDANPFKNGISKNQAHELLLKDMKRTMDDFELLLQRKKIIDLTIEQERILFEMAYTMGCDKLSKFNKMWKSIQNSNSHRFVKEIKNSKWYNQVGSNRVDILLSSI